MPSWFDIYMNGNDSELPSPKVLNAFLDDFSYAVKDGVPSGIRIAFPNLSEADRTIVTEQVIAEIVRYHRVRMSMTIIASQFS